MAQLNKDGWKPEAISADDPLAKAAELAQRICVMNLRMAQLERNAAFHGKMNVLMCKKLKKLKSRTQPEAQ